MRKKEINKIACVIIVLGLFLSAGLNADEKTGREFNELIKEMNDELSTAKEKVEKIEEQRIAQNNINPAEVIPERAKALKELETYKKEMDREQNPVRKKELEKQVESKVLQVSQLSTDFIETMKNDLQSQDQQLEIIEESISDVIMKMDKLRGMVQTNLNGTSPEEAKLKARKSLHSLAQMVEVLATKHKNAQQWTHIRRTIMLQDRILQKGSFSTGAIKKMLGAQQNVYEQVLAQVSVARRAILSEKEILTQVALGEVAKSMLRKAASLLVGNESIAQVGETAFVQSEVRQQHIMSFLEQDQSEGVYTGIDMNVSSSNDSSSFPDGYQNYINNGIVN
jgi:hypothetical protein